MHIIHKAARYLNGEMLRRARIEGTLLKTLRQSFGTLLKKAFGMLVKAPGRLERKLDYAIGARARRAFMRELPVQPNLVVFWAFQGDYTDNPKYICEELIRRHTDCEIVWIGRREAAEHPELFPDEVSAVYEMWSLEAFEALARAKVLVINSVELFKQPFEKKPGQYVLETWHGSLGIKRFDRKANSGGEWVRAADTCAGLCDYLLSNSAFETDIYRGTFWPETEILEYGHPRNDCLIRATEEERRRLRAKFFAFTEREDRGEQILLYAPTFRDMKDLSCCDLSSDTLIAALKERFGGEWVAVYRHHPTIRDYFKEKGILLQADPGVIDGTDYPDMQELLQIADVGVTDYSSWIFDFALTERPAFLFATDIRLYNNERGFAYPLEETPFPIAEDNKQMEKNILRFDNDAYQAERGAFLAGKGCVEDGHAAERSVDKILELLSR